LYYFLEIFAVVFGLAFLYFLINQRIICWVFGIVSSLLSIFLFYHSQLYSEAILYSYYVVMGFYGFYLWNKKEENLELKSVLRIRELAIKYHLYFLMICLTLSMLLAYIFESYTNADKAYLDAFTTIFSFLATYLEAKKILSAWIYWIVINGVTIVLYLSKDLDVYAGLSVVYFVMSFVGYYRWKQAII
jgi:nicotinamide mononucleotide transporter